MKQQNIKYFGLKFSMLFAVLALTACGSGGTSSNPTPTVSPTILPTTPIQAFATVITDEISYLQVSGTTNSPVQPGLVAFPNAESSSPEAYLVAYTGEFTKTSAPSGGYYTYINPTLYTYNNSIWNSKLIPFNNPNTLVTNLIVANNGLYMVAESYARVNTNSSTSLTLYTPQLYQYSNESLNNVSNNPYVTKCNTSCNITSLTTSGNNVIYLAGWNDDGTQVYSYDGSNWTNLLSQPSNQLTITSLAIDNNDNLYASGYSGSLDQSGSPYFAVYSSGKWNVLPNANAGAITFNGTDLFSLVTTSTNSSNPYMLYKLIANYQWSLLGVLAQNLSTGLEFNQLVSDQYGNIYANIFSSPIYGSGIYIDQPITQLVFSN